MTDLYEIETERLLLRQWREGDWVGLGRTYSDPEVMSWIGSMPSDIASTAAAVGRMSMHGALWVMGCSRSRSDPAPRSSGRVGLMLHPDWPLEGPKVEVGWTLQRSVWGRGYATEAAKASLEFGFRRLGLPQIFSMTRPDNTRSRAVWSGVA